MNNKMRTDLKHIKQRLQKIEEQYRESPWELPDISALKREVSVMVNDEERKIDRIPDNLYFSKRTDKLIDSLGKLEDVEVAFEDVDTADSIDETLEALLNICKHIDIAIR